MATATATGWKLTINGVDETARVDAITIATSLNDRARATIVISDALAARHQEIVSYRKDGVTPMFGGIIVMRSYAGRSQSDPDYQATLECGDFFAFTDWAYTSLAFPAAVTLKAVLQALVTDHLAQYGIVLAAAQEDGPTLEPFTWTMQRISDALRELSDRTGYVAAISPTKVLRMSTPGSRVAPFTITESAPNIHDLTWHDNDQTVANKVTIICGPTGVQQVADERHYGDGVTRIWPLNSPFVQVVGALSRSDSEGGWPLGTYGVDDFPYTYEAATNSVHQRADEPVVPPGEYIWLWYMAQFPFTVTATTGATPVIEHVEARPEVLSKPVGQEIANGLLSQRVSTPREVSFLTDLDGLEAGQAIVIDLPTTRQISGMFVITAVTMTIVLDTTEGDAFWQYQVEAVESDLYSGSYLDQWRKLVGGGGGGGGSVVTGDGGGTLPPSGGGEGMDLDYLGEYRPGTYEDGDIVIGPDGIAYLCVKTTTTAPEPWSGVGFSPRAVAAGGPVAVFLGGSRQFAAEPDPAAWVAVPEHVRFFPVADFTGHLYLELWARAAGVGVTARLFNLTDGVDAVTTETIVSTVPVSVTLPVTVRADKVYRLEVLPSIDGEAVFGIGTLGD